MKVGIVTITNNGPNYGNKLQNYAVLKVFEKIGCSAKTMYNVESSTYQVSFVHRVKNLYLIILRKRDYRKRQKEEAFRLFSHRYLNYTKPIRRKVGKKLEKKFDYFSVGSDQVWNPNFECNEIHFEYLFLQFTSQEKKISYSASMGVDELSVEKAQIFRSYLQDFKQISVREEAAAKEIHKLTGKDVEVLIDPTMMLNTEEWMKIAIKPKDLDTDAPYILTYFLGEITDEINGDINSYAKNNNLRVLHFLDESQPEMFVVGPSEFIYLISHASIILTDSFHACVFSFLFKKPFQVYARKGENDDMTSRLDTMLGKFDLQRKYVNNGLKNELFECDYERGYQTLKIERQKTIDFLKNSIKMK